MKVSECMSAQVITVGQGESLQHAAQVMRDADVGFLPVVNLAGTPIGVVTDRDLAMKAVAEGIPLNKPINEIMSEHIHHIDREASVEDAVALMRERNVGRLVVTNEENRVAGVFSLGDAAVALGDHVIGNAVMDAVGRHSHIPAANPPVHI